MRATSSRLLPITGVAAGVIWAGTQIVADLLFVGDPDPVGDAAGTQQTLLDHQGAAMVTVLGSMYLAVLILFFAAATRRVLGNSTYASAAFGGGLLLALAMVSGGIGNFAILAAARHHDTAAITTLGYAESVTWPLLGAASGAFLLATGLGSRRTQAMPRWLWGVTVVLGVLALLGPGAFAFWLIAPVWFAVVGVALYRGERRSLLAEVGGSSFEGGRT
jgi:hypothetical protein